MKWTLEIEMLSGSSIFVDYKTKKEAENAMGEILSESSDWIKVGDPRRIIRLSNVECITMESE